MQESKLYRWLSRLDRGEQNAYVRYVEALGGKNREELGRMARLFVKKVLRGKGMDRAAFYVAMGWPSPYKPALLHARLSDLKKKLEAFLAIQDLRRDPVAVAAYQLRSINKRGWTDFGKAEIKQARETLDAARVDVDVFRYAMQIEESRLAITMESARRFKEPAYQESMRRLEEFYCLQKLRYACAAKNQDHIFNTQHDYTMLPAVLEEMAPRLDGLPPVLRMYFHTCQMLTFPEQAGAFQQLKAELAEQWPKLKGELAREFYTYLINHCIRRVNAGFPDFKDEIVRIYTETMDSGVLLQDGMIDAASLKNMVGLVTRAGNFEVAKQLLSTYGPKLGPGADPVTVDYILATICFHEGEYSKARRMLENVLRDAEDVFFIVDARIYSWRASYELGDLELGEDNYNALRMYLSRDKLLPKATHKAYMDFATGLNALSRIQAGEIKSSKAALKFQDLLQKLNALPGNANILWLREKVAQAIARL